MSRTILDLRFDLFRRIVTLLTQIWNAIRSPSISFRNF